MRIRRRPPVSLSQLDPSLQVNPPSTNGTGGGAAAGVDALHPVEDLKIHHPLQINFPVSLSDPYPDQILLARRHQLQAYGLAVQGVKEEEEGTRVDSNEGCNGWASSCCSSSSSGAVAPSGAVQAGEMVAPQKKTGGGSSYGNGSVGSTSLETKQPVMELQEDRVKVRVPKGRATSATPSPTVSVLDNNCTSNSSGSGGSNTNSAGKRRKSPAGMMEGSRCSRVNGRGWRCCQQTLVGYSLCEHHLGKGRLRSMSSSVAAVRGQLGTSKPKWRINLNGAIASTTNSVPPSQALEEKEKEKPLATVLVTNEADKVEEEKAITARKTSRRKTSMVKARSISSLLDDTNQDHHSPPTLAPLQMPQVAPSIDQ